VADVLTYTPAILDPAAAAEEEEAAEEDGEPGAESGDVPVPLPLASTPVVVPAPDGNPSRSRGSTGVRLSTPRQIAERIRAGYARDARF
jgi:hypothetical protein